jgi:hypothetical protein
MPMGKGFGFDSRICKVWDNFRCLAPVVEGKETLLNSNIAHTVTVSLNSAFTKIFQAKILLHIELP